MMGHTFLARSLQSAAVFPTYSTTSSTRGAGPLCLCRN